MEASHFMAGLSCDSSKLTPSKTLAASPEAAHWGHLCGSWLRRAASGLSAWLLPGQGQPDGCSSETVTTSPRALSRAQHCCCQGPWGGSPGSLDFQVPGQHMQRPQGSENPAGTLWSTSGSCLIPMMEPQSLAVAQEGDALGPETPEPSGMEAVHP